MLSDEEREEFEERVAYTWVFDVLIEHIQESKEYYVAGNEVASLVKLRDAVQMIVEMLEIHNEIPASTKGYSDGEDAV